MTELTISIPMIRAMFQLSQSMTGWVPARWFDGRCARALERRGLVREALDFADGAEAPSYVPARHGYCPTPAGKEFIETHWPACPFLLDREPAEGWTPEKGVGWGA